MAGVKISNLPAIVTPAVSDIFAVVQGGITYKETITQLQSLLTLNTVSVTGLQNQSYTYIADTGSADAYIGILTSPILNYVAGQRFDLLISNTNTTTSTLNINSIGNKTILREDGTTLVAGDLIAGMIASFEYNGTTFQLINPARRLLGTNTNNNATAGYVGETISSVVLVGSAVALTTNVTSNITSISLTAGDWDVFAEGYVTGTGGCVVQNMSISVSTVSATYTTPLPALASACAATGGISLTIGTDNLPIINIGPARLSLASTTTVYFLANFTFITQPCSAYGKIVARRAR